jgi:hypothetical protein
MNVDLLSCAHVRGTVYKNIRTVGACEAVAPSRFVSAHPTSPYHPMHPLPTSIVPHRPGQIMSTFLPP